MSVCSSFAIFLFCLLIPTISRADVFINLLAANGADNTLEKEVQFSLPGELKPEDVLDTAGLKLDYNVNDVGYYLHGKVSLKAKETKTFRVRVRDVWKITPEKIQEIKTEIQDGFNELGAEKNKENGSALKEVLEKRLEDIVQQEEQSTESVQNRIDSYRYRISNLNEIGNSARLIDYWRTDPRETEITKTISFNVELENPSEKTKRIKKQFFLPKEVKPEHIVERNGYELRFDERKNQPFLFKEEDIDPKTKKTLVFQIKDIWYVFEKDINYIRERTAYVTSVLQETKFSKTARDLSEEIINNLDLIDMLQKLEQPDIEQHIGAYRINKGRYDQAKEALDSLEKLLLRHRADLEKSRIKNVLQKIQTLKSLARISEAIFDKKPTVNAAWKIIGSVMVFLAIFTILHFVTWFIRTAKEKKQEEVKISVPKEGEEEKA